MLKKIARWKKIVLALFIVLAAFFVVLPIIISPLAKYFIEKYDLKIIGRHIRVGFVYISPFTGHVHISNLRVFEKNSDTVFFEAKGVTARFALLKMLHKTYQIDNITVNQPKGRIIQNRQALNFDDIIAFYAPKDTTTPKKASAPVHFNILNIKIEDGQFYYTEQSIPVNYFIKEVNIESPGKRWDVDSMLIQLSLKSGPTKGDIDGHFTINFSSLDYNFAVAIKKFDLAILNQYIKDLSNFGTLRANLDASLKARGNFGSKLQLDANGKVDVSDFHFGKNLNEDYASFTHLSVGMRQLNPMANRYYFDTIKLVEPYFRYERYDHLDNIQQMFGENGSKIAAANADSTKFNLVIEIAKFVRDLAQNLIVSYYKAERLEIDSANIEFNDYSLREKFGVAAIPLNISADSIDKNSERINVYLNTNIKPYGKIGVSFSFDPNDYTYFDLNYGLKKVPLAEFNPYVINYTSFPLNQGTLEFNGNLDVVASNLKSDNHLLILDPRVAKKIRKSGTHWLPLPLIMSIVKSRGGVIDYDIPIAGNLKDPKFKLRDIILHTLENIFIKPPSTPYLVHVKETEKNVENMLAVKWQMHATQLLAAQETFMNGIAAFLHNNSNVSITLTPFEYADKETEYVLLYEAKKKYYLQANKLSSTQLTYSDSIRIERLSPKDSLFMRYLNKFTKDTLVFTMQHKCYNMLDSNFVKRRYEALQAARKKTMMAFFESKGVAGQVKITASQYTVPYNGFSYFRVNYAGDIPQKLLKDYEEMEKLNDENPRGKYEKERDKNGGTLGVAR